jgi:hypothetical protein
MSKTLLLALSLFAATVQAAQDSDPLRAKARVESYAPPQHVSVVYDLYRNGHKLGQVTDTLTRDRQPLHRSTSETRATGPLKALVAGQHPP